MRRARHPAPESPHQSRSAAEHLGSRFDRDVGVRVVPAGHARQIPMVTHNPEIADALPRVVEMRDGRVVAERRGAELVEIEA